MNNKVHNSISSDDSYWVVIPAAGSGSRMQSTIPKQFHLIDNYPIIVHTISQFLDNNKIAGIMVVVEKGNVYSESIKNAYSHSNNLKPLRFCEGGKTRMESVLAGLKIVADAVNPQQWVLVHDAARPGITQSILTHFLSQIETNTTSDGYLLGRPATDTIKQIGADKFIKATLNRNEIWTAQTPQAFQHQQLQHCLDSILKLDEDSAKITDESSAMEHSGFKVKFIEGNSGNFKITTAEDLTRMDFEIMQQLKRSDRVHPNQFFKQSPWVEETNR